MSGESASPSPSPSPNRFERRRQQNRTALLEAALELFQQQGIRATKLEAICERADVAPRTFFNHFESREHLYVAIAEQRAAQLAAALDAVSRAEGPLSERLVVYFRGMGAYLAVRPLYRELVREMLNHRLDGGNAIARDRTLGLAARRFVEAEIARGGIASPHPPEILADILLGAITTSLVNWCASEDFDLERALVDAARALLDLFRTPEQ